MRAFGVTVLMLFKHYFRDRTSVFWGLVFPLLLMGLIGLAFGRGENLSFTVGLVDEGGGPVTQGLRQGLGQVPVFRLTDEENRSSALDALRRGRRTLVVVIPRLGSGDVIRVYFDQARLQESRTAMVIFERFVAEANLRIAGVRPALRVEATGVAAARRIRFFDFLLPGILAMTVMNSGLNGLTWVITEYRQRLVLKRVLATPVHPLAFLSGLIARYAATNLVQLVVIVVIAVVVFNATIVGSLWILTGLALLGTLVFVGMGIALSTASRTPESANLLGSALSFPMMFLAGTFWPREYMPGFLQPVISALPLTPLVEVMRAVAARGESVVPYWTGLLYLVAWGIVSFVLAAWRFKWE
ncbi:MAG TPA: ABC transporter permease [bacterium]|nr:ABC transporter permease [bacterium]